MLRPDQIAALYAASCDEDGLARMAALVREVVGADGAVIQLTEDGRVVELAARPEAGPSPSPCPAPGCREPWASDEPPSGRGLAYDGPGTAADPARGDRLNGSTHPPPVAGAGPEVAQRITGPVATEPVSAARPAEACPEARLAELLLHLRGALRLRHRLQAERTARHALAGALDRACFGAVVCAADGSVLFANDAARALDLAGALSLEGRGAGLGAARSEDTRRLRTLVAAAASTGMPGGCRLAWSGGTVSAVVVPLPESPPGAGGRALVALRCEDAAPGLRAADLRRLFDLSPAQAALCVQLLRGLTVEAAAAERGVSITTARTHLLGIVQRTGTKSLRDLLRLLGSLPPVTTPAEEAIGRGPA